MYPALLLAYAGGIAAVGANNYGSLAALLVRARARELRHRKEVPFGMALEAEDILGRDLAQHVLDPQGRHYTPVSDYLEKVLREPLRELLPRDVEYVRCFDRFEYLLALITGDLSNQVNDVQDDGRQSDPLLTSEGLGKFAPSLSPNAHQPAANPVKEGVNRMHGDPTTARKARPRGRPFKRGFDPRRHVFTWEECSEGFYAAMASISARNPNATFTTCWNSSCAAGRCCAALSPSRRLVTK